MDRYYRTNLRHDREARGKRIPLGRVGFTQDVAPPALFLAGDGARCTTGETILVDVGLIVRMAL